MVKLGITIWVSAGGGCFTAGELRRLLDKVPSGVEIHLAFGCVRRAIADLKAEVPRILLETGTNKAIARGHVEITSQDPPGKDMGCKVTCVRLKNGDLVFLGETYTASKTKGEG